MAISLYTHNENFELYMTLSSLTKVNGELIHVSTVIEATPVSSLACSLEVVVDSLLSTCSRICCSEVGCSDYCRYNMKR